MQKAFRLCHLHIHQITMCGHQYGNKIIDMGKVITSFGFQYFAILGAGILLILIATVFISLSVKGVIKKIHGFGITAFLTIVGILLIIGFTLKPNYSLSKKKSERIEKIKTEHIENVTVWYRYAGNYGIAGNDSLTIEDNLTITLLSKAFKNLRPKRKASSKFRDATLKLNFKDGLSLYIKVNGSLELITIYYDERNNNSNYILSQYRDVCLSSTIEEIILMHEKGVK